MKIQAESQNLGARSELRRMFKIWAEKLCGIVKFMRHIIYARTKADVEISASDEHFRAYQKLGAQVVGGVCPVLYRLLYRHDLSKFLRIVRFSAHA